MAAHSESNEYKGKLKDVKYILEVELGRTVNELKVRNEGKRDPVQYYIDGVATYPARKVGKELVLAEECTQSCVLDGVRVRCVPNISWLSESVYEGRRLGRNSAEEVSPDGRAEAPAGYAGERRTQRMSEGGSHPIT